ncbi:hypothetical protein [Haloarcula sp. Atlit-7R]|uniref:hypothetical protein n=1 Tax=Haloarcula sp. Atlit-7R TaxID=2282125 RepID=UPI000EF158A8|nr:hypothetical protein [Haloarcula sp. Atlit-7R]RLM91120.1 hypothetical protein D3D01_16485 [Haloarcula sp. Atlit-7R]
MVGVLSSIRYVINTYLSSAVGNFFEFGRQQIALLIVLTLTGSALLGVSPVEAIKTVGAMSLRRTTALWGITSVRRAVTTGLIEILVWEGIAFLGCTVSGYRLYQNTD